MMGQFATERALLLVVALEFSENSGCHGQPKEEGFRGERASVVCQLCRPLPGWCDDLSRRACGDRRPKFLVTPSGGLLHVVNISSEGFLCPIWISHMGQGREGSLCHFPAPLPWRGSVCGPLGRAFSESGDSGMSPPSWVERHARRAMLWASSVTLSGYVFLLLLCDWLLSWSSFEIAVSLT